MKPERASRLRQRIQEKVEMLGMLVRSAQERSGMLAGSFYERRRRCGKRGCRCAQGALHRNMALAMVGSGGRRRVVSLAGVELDKTSDLTLCYRRFRQARAEWVRTFGELLGTFDELGRLRRVEVRDLSRSSTIG